MEWKVYKVVFRIKAPIHIGYRKYGNLMETRPYIPARVFLGALTARITRTVFGPTQNWRYYRIVGEILNQVLTASYFYPTTNADGKIKVFPWDDEFLHYGFVGSYVSTALQQQERASEDGSLHEVEFISPRTRNGGKQVYLSGYFFVRENVDRRNIPASLLENLKTGNAKLNLLEDEIEQLETILKEIEDNEKLKEIISKVFEWKTIVEALQVGGERGYGWGMIELQNTEEHTKEQIFNRYSVDQSGNRPGIKIEKEDPLPCHLIAQDNPSVITGYPEPLVRREWRKGPGSKIVFDGLSYPPGAVAICHCTVTLNTLGYGIVGG